MHEGIGNSFRFQTYLSFKIMGLVSKLLSVLGDRLQLNRLV
jgi:hypothetical protein